MRASKCRSLLLPWPDVSVFRCLHNRISLQYQTSAAQHALVGACQLTDQLVQDLVEVLSDRTAWNTPRKADQATYEVCQTDCGRCLMIDAFASAHQACAHQALDCLV